VFSLPAAKSEFARADCAGGESQLEFRIQKISHCFSYITGKLFLTYLPKWQFFD
jgi:hypothetical protein